MRAEIVGESMGFRQDDHYKHLKVMQDADAIVMDAADLIAQHGLNTDTARRVVLQGMLGDQPLPPMGGVRSIHQVVPSWNSACLWRSRPAAYGKARG